jgi:hypothetical protein
LSLRPRPPTITIRDDSPTSSWIHFFRDKVSPLLEEREGLEGISENKREELKHKTNEDFGLLEPAKNAGKSVKKKHGYYIFFTLFAILMNSWVLIGHD